MAKYALCIGINDYPGTGSDLSGCVNDGNDWGAVLTKPGFTTTKMFDKQATGKNLRAASNSECVKKFVHASRASARTENSQCYQGNFRSS